MYKKGQLRKVAPPCETFLESEGECDFSYDDDDNHTHFIYDSLDDVNEKKVYPVVYLPHSCNEWIIGGTDEIELLIKDLQSALEEIREKQKYAK